MQEILRAHIEKIIPLNDEEFEFILGHFSFGEFRKNEFLTQVGEPATYSYFIVSGLVKLVYTDTNVKEHIVAFAMEDWWESDFNAFYTSTPATMSLQCVEDTTVYRCTLQDYKSLCTGLQKMERFFLEKANNGYLGLQKRIISWLSSNSRERYERLLQHHPELVKRVPKSLLASYLGVSRETLSRLY